MVTKVKGVKQIPRLKNPIILMFCKRPGRKDVIPKEIRVVIKLREINTVRGGKILPWGVKS